MRKLLLSIPALLFAMSTFAQKDTVGLNLPIKDGNVVFEQVVDAPGKTKAELYKNAKQWFVDYFKSSKDVIQSEDKEEGRIVGKGILPVLFNGALGMKVMYDDKLSIQVDCKENKYRFRIYEQVLSSPGPSSGQVVTTPEALIAKLLGTGKSPFNDKQARRMLESMKETINLAILSFNKGMSKKADDF